MSKRISYKMPEQLFHADRSTDAMQHLDELDQCGPIQFVSREPIRVRIQEQ